MVTCFTTSSNDSIDLVVFVFNSVCKLYNRHRRIRSIYWYFCIKSCCVPWWLLPTWSQFRFCTRPIIKTLHLPSWNLNFFANLSRESFLRPIMFDCWFLEFTWLIEINRWNFCWTLFINDVCSVKIVFSYFPDSSCLLLSKLSSIRFFYLNRFVRACWFHSH